VLTLLDCAEGDEEQIAFWISRVVSTRAETGSSAQGTDASDQVRKATIT
jgi:hypothetical protein